MYTQVWLVLDLAGSKYCISLGMSVYTVKRPTVPPPHRIFFKGTVDLNHKLREFLNGGNYVTWRLV
jgi:hypothetical protein